MENKWIKIIIGITVSVIIVFTTGSFIFYKLLTESLPEYEGEKDFGHLNSEVKIYRDKYAIPYILASSDEDAAFALGYIHAQERLFQMDTYRRAAEGRLSEVFGTKTLNYDKMFRVFGMSRMVYGEYDKMEHDLQIILDAYTKGVNAYIKEARGKYSIEFDALGYEPESWKPEHSLMIAKLLAWELNISWWTDIMFTHLVQVLGEEKVKEVLPDYPENAPTIIPSGIATFPKVDTSIVAIDKSFRNFMGFTGTHLGSNNWVVNGNKSVSGKPIIANDPHLTLQAPGRWFTVVIRAQNWKADGFTIPGTPCIVIGKNENISWTLTNVMADDTDFYIEKIDSSGKNYFFNGEWRSLINNDYTINVKDSESVHITVKSTHRGPIISDFHLIDKKFPGKRPYADISMQWVGHKFHDEFKAIYGINTANNWKEFRNAISYFSVPGQNFVYADKEGNIGYICGAKIPVRSGNSSTFAFDGTTGQNDWNSFVPYEQMPVLFNPPQNYIATANNKVIKGFAYHISNLWEPTSRIERISNLLNSKGKHSVRDFKAYQMDLISPYAGEVAQYLLNAFKKVKIKDNNLKTSLELLYKWDYELNEYSQVPSIYEVFFQYLLKNTFQDEMGEVLCKEYNFVANVPYRTVMNLMKNDSSKWFDNIKTEKVETRDAIIRSSMADALSYLEGNYGKDPKNWQWGKLHKINLKHQFHGISSFIDNFIDIGPYSIGGDGTTVFNTEFSFNEPFETILGPSMRFIYDFSQPDKFYVVLPTGQSGNVFSDHYKDMTEMWLSGKYVEVNTNESMIRNSGYKLFILK